MIKIDTSKLNLQYFLSSKVKITDIVKGALKYGGATYNLDKNDVWSNVHENEFISIKKESNTVSIFIPTTMNINQKATSEKVFHIMESVAKRMEKISHCPCDFSRGMGSWYSDELDQVVTENIIIVEHEINKLTEKEIRQYMDIANYVKKSMSQEGVSISINDSLLIV